MPIIDHHAPIRVMAAVRGHPFDRTAFATLFDGMAGVSVTFVDQPAAALLMRPELADAFDVLLLYDMPGIDFSGPIQGPGLGWDQPAGSNLISWAKRAENSPLVYLQPGDDAVTYANPHYRQLVEKAIRWTASPDAKRWAGA
jgi:hypothetical protein